MGATPNWTYIEALKQLEAMQHYNEYHGSKKQMLEYQNQLIKEIQAGNEIETDNIRIFNSSLLVPKPDEKQRKILDCRNINQLTTPLKFKMEGVESIKQILEPSDFAITLDLQDVYHHIRVPDQLFPYFGFTFMGRLSFIEVYRLAIEIPHTFSIRQYNLRSMRSEKDGFH
ncbi:MAG: hypothetical protein EZS28_002975 [Streblomastix strix]|uniref:Reverse transcriptase domain-containing protein n=1 Tax=Streblomastix strix TaxID=222440 RepID=A0A5J4X3Z8_9EUKA|nr:MAG: hypothetical protein EZS28_002975 [Streblomastix strix]